MGDAWGHIAIRTDDVYEAYDELMEKGVEDYRDPDSCGGSYAFVKDPDGYDIEITGREPLRMEPGLHNQRYLDTKRSKLGHLL